MRLHTIEPASYPAGPGHSGTETSRLAAESVRSQCGHLRQQVLSVLAAGPRSTRDLANILYPVPYETVQPRLSELHRASLIRPSGHFARGLAGKRVVCWELVENPPPFRRVAHPRRRVYPIGLTSVNLGIQIVRLLARRASCTDEIARALDRPYGAIQPRVSDLRSLGVIEPSGSHGFSRFGKKVVRWRLRSAPYHPALPEQVAQVLRECFAAATPPDSGNGSLSAF